VLDHRCDARLTHRRLQRAPTAPLAVAGDTTTEMVFAEQLAGPTVDGLPYAKMMFMQIAAPWGNLGPDKLQTTCSARP
jgi:hypothetical protein